jgi:hypothetical protein
MTCEGDRYEYDDRLSSSREADARGSSFASTDRTEALGVPGVFICDAFGLAALESQPSMRWTASRLSTTRSRSLVLLGAPKVGRVVLDGTEGAIELGAGAIAA